LYLNAVKVPPMKRYQIREVALDIRSKFGIFGGRFPIIDFIEFVLPKVMTNFEFSVEDGESLGDNHGLTYPDDRIIILREDVYHGAIAGNGRDRMTAAHELGHLLLHKNIPLAKSDNRIQAFESSEWQANCFAGELLIPFEQLNVDGDLQDIANFYGVSLEAARYQVAIKRKNIVRS